MCDEGTMALLAAYPDRHLLPEVNTHNYSDVTLHTPPRAHTHPCMHAKNVQSFDLGTILVMVGWALLPVFCISHYRLGYSATPKNPNYLSDLKQPESASLFCKFIVDLGDSPGQLPSRCWLGRPHFFTLRHLCVTT